MATHVLDILNAHTRPDDSGRAFFEPYDIKASNDVFKHLVLVLNDPGASQNHGIHGAFRVPKNYAGAPKVVVEWTTTATTGTVLFAFDYRAIGGDDAESLDQASFQEQLDLSDGAPSAAHEKMTATFTLTAGNLAADDIVEFYFYRDGTTGAPTDSLAAAVTIHGLYFMYDEA